MAQYLVPVLGFLWAQAAGRNPVLCVLGSRLLCTRAVASLLAPLEGRGLHLCIFGIRLLDAGGDWKQFRNHLRLATSVLTCICIHIVDIGLLPIGWGKQKSRRVEEEVGLMDLGLGYFIVVNSLESRPPHSILLVLASLRLLICTLYPCADHLEYGWLWNAYLTLFCTQWVLHIIRNCSRSLNLLLCFTLQTLNLLLVKLPHVYDLSGLIACVTGYIPLGILARLLLVDSPSHIPLPILFILGVAPLLTRQDARLCNPSFTYHILNTCLLCRSLTFASLQPTRIRSGPIILLCNILTGLYKSLPNTLLNVLFEVFYLMALILSLRHWSLAPSSSQTYVHR